MMIYFQITSGQLQAPGQAEWRPPLVMTHSSPQRRSVSKRGGFGSHEYAGFNHFLSAQGWHSICCCRAPQMMPLFAKRVFFATICLVVAATTTSAAPQVAFSTHHMCA